MVVPLPLRTDPNRHITLELTREPASSLVSPLQAGYIGEGGEMVIRMVARLVHINSQYTGSKCFTSNIDHLDNSHRFHRIVQRRRSDLLSDSVPYSVWRIG